ncbi:MAG: DedA family protein [Actinomycetota bacterium]|nr:DedA family protein [Actinomycetota bacterium]
MFGLIERLVEWIAPAYVHAGYAIVAGGVLAERSILIGLFVPGDVILALGGIYAARHDLSLTLVIVIGTFAAIIGESTGYWLGRRYGLALVKRLPLVRRLEDRIEGAQEYFKRHGGKTVALGRYATAAGAFIPFVAGIGRMGYRRFLLFDVPAVVLWAAGITLFGYYFGEHIDFVDTVLSRFGLIMLGLLAVVIGGSVLMRRRRES